MKLLFLGTGAADWSPKHKGGKLYRRLSSALVNDDLLIDPGPCIYDFAEEYGKPDLFKNVKNVILTHSHSDHFNVQTLLRITRESNHQVCFWAQTTAFDKLLVNLNKDDNCPFYHIMTPEKPEKVGNYDVIPCLANHGDLPEGEIPLNYIVKSEGRCFFYGSDSGWIMYPTYKQIKKNKPNALIFECTTGYAPGDERIFGHTSIAMIGIMMESIVAQKATAEDCKYYATHMARTLHTTHEDTAERLAPFGVTPAYDGLEIDI
jgi:phosphoribosyl 1,2-cyclic phosphate phosphodiesterase